MNRVCIFICVAVFLFSECVTAKTNPPDTYTLTKIEFLGNSFFSSDYLLEQLALYPTNEFNKVILSKKPSIYNEEALQRDLKRLARFYQREGFLHAQVEKFKAEANPANKTIQVTIKIFEGEPVLVGQVGHQISASTSEDEKRAGEIWEALAPAFELAPGVRFRDVAMLNDQKRLLEKFNRSGYPYVNPTYQLHVVADQSVDINWQITLGPRCVFGAISLSGNQRIPEKLIRRQLALKEGQLFDPNLLSESQKQIYRLGFFQLVTVKALLSEEQSATIPVQVVVKEAPRFTTRFGLGYGDEDKFRAFASLRHIGSFGGTRHTQLLAKHSELEPYNFNLKLIQPSFISSTTTLIVNPFFLQQQEPAYTATRLGGDLTLQRELTEKPDAYATYSLEKVDQQEASAATPLGADRNPANLYNKSSVRVGLRHDTSTPFFNPSRGMRSAFSFKFSGLGFDSEFHFTQVILDLRRYTSFFTNHVFAYRLKIGALNSLDNNVPVEERFFAGGSSSVRGWSRAQLGPLDAEGKPIGGNSLLEASVEWRFPIWKFFAGAAFTDFGNVWQASYAFKLDDLRFSAGLGLRVDTPIGPMRLDVARPIFDDETNPQIHLSVGHAF